MIDKSIDAPFEAFWQAGMRKIGKQGALKAFKRSLLASKQPPDGFASLLVSDVTKRLGRQMGFDQMHPATYLNGERWKDELPTADACKQKDAYDAWHSSNEGTKSKAAELGMMARGGETYHDFRIRILAEIRRREGVTQ